MVSLGASSDRIPSALFLSVDGQIHVGEAAARLGERDPAGLATDFKSHVGGNDSLIVRTSPFSAEALLAKIIAHVVQRVTELEGAQPGHTVVTHPTSWNSFRIDLVEQAVKRADVDRCSLTTEAEAAAHTYAARHPLVDGDTIATYELGAGSFEAAVLRHHAGTFSVLACQTIPGLGGEWFADAIVALVTRELVTRGSEAGTVPAADPRFRHLCSAAKDLLSIDDSAEIPVPTRSGVEVVSVSRRDFEAMINDQVDLTVTALSSVIDSTTGGISPVAVMPIGGSSRMPIVLRSLRDRFGTVVVNDVDPQTAVARGAALTARRRGADASTPAAPTQVIEPPSIRDLGPMSVVTRDLSTQSSRRRPMILAAAVLAVVAIGAAAFLSLGGDDDDGGEAAANGPGGSEGGEPAPDAPDLGDGGDNGARETSSDGPIASAAGMVLIPSGSYSVGAENPEPFLAESPLTDVTLDGFNIDEHEVTNADFQAFIDATGAESPATWSGGIMPAGQGQHPVRGVTYDWATAFCTSIDKRLPTEAEWEVTASGSDGRLYPWGDDSSAVSLPATGTYPVGSVADNVTELGVYDLVGNAWEWVGDTYDPRLDPALRVMRGGQNGYVRKNTTRLPLDPLRSNAVNIAGFRCAASAVDDGIAPLAFGDYERPTTPPVVEPEPLPDGVLVLDTFQDPTSGWIEVSNEQGRFGYHPNEYFHLETKVGGEEVLAFGPTVLDPTQAVSISTAARVEPNLTGEKGDFKFGIAFAFDTSSDDRPGLVFLADPRNQLWLLCQRRPGGGYDVLTEGPFNWLDLIELRVESDGEGTFDFYVGDTLVYTRPIPEATGSSSGFVLLSSPDSTVVHIHFDTFEIAELD